uniref:Pre-rRNA-processing protein ESF2 n=1 Tax=Noccaea caerulescens TaxID=107243 RepID=A0A1J3JUR3_NOCCA
MESEEECHELGIEISKEESKERIASLRTDRKKKKLKERLLKETAKADNRGVCYLSRIPPHMDHVRLRQILSQFGDIGRIYLAPENPEAQVHRKKAGGFRGQLFSEGWVEFGKKRVAKRVTEMLNGEQIGGKKKSTIYYDIWNIKYLTKFKWDDLTDEIAYKSAIREQKLTMVLSAAKREKDFYLSKVEKSRAMTEIDARMEKKRKIQEESGSNAEAAPVFPPRKIRQFRQKKSITNETSQSKPGLSTDVLASVFGGS